MLGGDMGDLVAHDAREFCFGVHFGEESAGDEDLAARECEGVDIGCVEDGELPGEVLVEGLDLLGDGVSDAVDILVDGGVLEFAAVGRNGLLCGLLAEADLGGLGEVVDLVTAGGGVGDAGGVEGDEGEENGGEGAGACGSGGGVRHKSSIWAPGGRPAAAWRTGVRWRPIVWAMNATIGDGRGTADGGGVVWEGGELAGDPHAHEQKAAKVRAMFASIAGSYDLNNRVHSFGRDQAWRRAAVRMAALDRGEDEVLDVACGTGDLSRSFADGGAKRVVGLDYTPEMLDIARSRRGRGLGCGAMGAAIEYVDGDATALPFDDGSFDVVSIAFGIRNVSDPGAALGEFRRVLRPGGRLVVLEFGTPGFGPVRWASKIYTDRVMPWTATLISGDRSGAYRYLPRSVSTFMEPGELAAAIGRAGFGEVSSRNLTFGVAVVHRGVLGAG